MGTPLVAEMATCSPLQRGVLQAVRAHKHHEITLWNMPLVWVSGHHDQCRYLHHAMLFELQLLLVGWSIPQRSAWDDHHGVCQIVSVLRDMQLVSLN
jgi:hypothetical protein